MTPVWFVAALLPMIVSQILRLHQHGAASWVFWDYTGRLCGLAVLAAIPAARVIAFRREPRRLPLRKIALGVAGIVLLCIGVVGLGRMVNAAFPMTILGFASITGALFMRFYQRCGALWPVILAHYLVDLYFFA